jgi:hypothetical protein
MVIIFAIVLASMAIGMAGTSAYFTRKLIRILVPPKPAIEFMDVVSKYPDSDGPKTMQPLELADDDIRKEWT